MSIPLRQSTASQEVILGPFLDETDGITPENALTIANTDIQIWVQGATATADKTSGGATYITSSSGLYVAVFDATDTATLGAFVVFVHVAGALPVRVECVVLTAANYDAAIAGTGVADVNVVSISGDTTAADNLEASADGTGYNLGGGSIVASSVTGSVGSVATGGISADSIAADAITDAKVASDVTIASVTGAVGSVTGAVGSVTGNVGGNVTGSVGSVAAGGITAASFAADAITAAKVAADVATEIATAVWGAATRLLTAGTNIVLAKGTGVTGFNDITAAEAADAVWDEAISGHLGAGSAGAALNAAGSAGDPWTTSLPGAYGAGTAGNIIGNNVDAAVSSRASQTSVDDLPTNTELATALGTADDAVLAAIAALNNLSAAGVRAAVGLATANLDTQLADLPTNSELTTALAGADDAILAAIAALNNLSAAQVNAEADQALVDAALATAANLAAAKSVVDAIKLSTDNLPSDPADQSLIIAATNALAATIAALNNISTAQVRTEVDGALDATVADSVPADGTRPSVRQAAYISTQFLLERAVGGTTMTVRKPDGSTALLTLTLDDADAPTSVTRAT